MFVAGQTTGKFNFDMFTHLRSSLDNPGWYVLPDPSLDAIILISLSVPNRVDRLVLKARFPPYTAEKQQFLAKLQKVKLPPRPSDKKKGRWGLWLVIALVGAVSGLLIKSGKISRLIKG